MKTLHIYETSNLGFILKTSGIGALIDLIYWKQADRGKSKGYIL